jgi:hypothetical protein
MRRMILSRQLATDTGRHAPAPELLARIGVRPPYFALYDLALEGLEFRATAEAESPAYLEHGPMPAAELGRHAAIAGLCHAAARQSDDRRRYFLANRAECRYLPSPAPYGTPVRFASRIVELTKRTCRAAVTAEAAGAPLAAFEVDYTILTESAFQRLFRSRARPTPDAPSPYGALLVEAGDGAADGSADRAEQVVGEVPASACVGHFDGYPALPVAVLMGQLSYLAGRLYGDPPRPYRVVRGEVAASDLAWAGETATFRAWRDGEGGAPGVDGTPRFTCEALAGDRRVGGMTLWLQSVDEGLGDDRIGADG